MSIENFYTETVYLQTETLSTAWGSTSAWTTGTTMLAAINPVSGDERFIGGKETVLADYKMFCSDTVSFSEINRVKWNSKLFDVIHVKDTFNMGHHKKVLLKNCT